MSGGSLTAGQNFWLREDGVVSFFGNTGRVVNGAWYGGMSSDDEPVWPMERGNLVLPRILQLIATDVANGHSNKLSQILVGPRQALMLYLEGAITPADIMRATEPDDGTICIPQIRFGERTLDVHVGPRSRLITANASGIPIT